MICSVLFARRREHLRQLVIKRAMQFLLAAICLTSLQKSLAASFCSVGADGSCRSASQLASSAASEGGKFGGNGVNVIGVIDYNSGCNSGFNDAMGTKFESAQSGAYVDFQPGAAIIYNSYEQMSSAGFCGSKAALFCAEVGDCTVLLLPSEDFRDVLKGFDQVVRQYFHQALACGSQASLVVMVDTASEVTQEDTTFIEDFLQDIWTDMVETTALTIKDHVSIKIVPKSALKASISAISAPKKPLDALGSTISESWVKVPSAINPILNSKQRQSLFVVESAYASSLRQAETVLNLFRKRLATGKTVKGFGERVASLYDSIRGSFYDKTRGSLVARDRAERAAMLSEFILSNSGGFLKTQLSLVSSKKADDFKKQLIKLYKGEFNAEEAEQLLRQVLYEYRTEAAELECQDLGLSAEDEIAELTLALETTLQEFPESNAARLESLRKMDRQAKKPKPKKGRAVNIGLNLVGMLRPPGYGNLQGFCSYSTGLMGMPLDILLGCQNDGDSPEVVGEDREYPFLRLQPKVHFDIDL
jgi:hypothetical protein